MRRKALISALAFVLALFLSIYLYLFFIAGRPLTFSEYVRFSSAILGNALLHSGESGGARSLRLAKAALASRLVIGTAEIKGQRYEYPLPKYSVRQEGQHYVTFASFDELQDYFHVTLPSSGWKHLDQAGAGHLFEKGRTKMVITHHFYLGTQISEFNVNVRE